MKFVAILSLALVLPSTQALTCLKYVCDPSGVTWGSNVCAMLDPKDTTQYDIKTGACTSSQSCAYDQKTTDTCQTVPTPPTSTAVAYPGEPCSTTNTCMGNIICDATTNACTTLKEGDACAHVEDCGGSLTCPANTAIAQTCTPLAAAGSACNAHTDCLQNAGCAGGSVNPLTAGICTNYSSISAQGKVTVCAATSTTPVSNPYCMSGYCYKGSDGSFACTDILENKSSIPSSCTTNADCLSKSDSKADTSLPGSCNCGFDGKAWCGLFPGDSPMKELTSDLAVVVGSTWLLSCNSVRNNGSLPSFVGNYCVTALGKPTNENLYHYWRATLYSQVVKADSCVLKAVNPTYYSLYEEESAAWMMLGGLVLALVN